MTERLLEIARLVYDEGWKHLWELRKKEVGASGNAIGNNSVRGEVIANILERHFKATGDPVFHDAIQALRSYDLDHGPAKSAIDKAENRDAVPLTLMRSILDGNRYGIDSTVVGACTVRRVAEQVVALCNVDAPMFETAVDELRTKYRAWQKAGFPHSRASGDLGYRVKVRLANTSVLLRIERDSLERIFSQGYVITEYSKFWRALFMRGAVSIENVIE